MLIPEQLTGGQSSLYSQVSHTGVTTRCDGAEGSSLRLLFSMRYITLQQMLSFQPLWSSLTTPGEL